MQMCVRVQETWQRTRGRAILQICAMLISSDSCCLARVHNEQEATYTAQRQPGMYVHIFTRMVMLLSGYEIPDFILSCG